MPGKSYPVLPHMGAFMGQTSIYTSLRFTHNSYVVLCVFTGDFNVDTQVFVIYLRPGDNPIGKFSLKSGRYLSPMSTMGTIKSG